MLARSAMNASRYVRPRLPDEFNYSLSKTKAIHLPHAMAFPAKYVVERSACPEGCHACVDACAYRAIDLTQKAEKKTLRVASVVVATGWAPYDAAKIENLGFGRCANVVTNVMVERFAAANGPTGGKILRPSDGKEPRSVAFVQCAGSRDQNHLPYCSARLLLGFAEAGDLHPKALSGCGDHDLLHRPANPGQLARLLCQGDRGKQDRTDQGQGRQSGRRSRPAGTVLVRPRTCCTEPRSSETTTWWCWRRAWCRRPAGCLRDSTSTNSVSSATVQQRLYGTGCVKRPAEVSATIRDATGAALKALQISVGAEHLGVEQHG